MADAGTVLLIAVGLSVPGCVADVCPPTGLGELVPTELPSIELSLAELVAGRALVETSLPGPSGELVAAVPRPARSVDAHVAWTPSPGVGDVPTTGTAVHASRDEPAPVVLGTHAARTGTPVTSGEALPAEGAAAAGALLALVGAALYHRLDRERLLGHPTRRRILELLEESPGMGTVAIAEAAGCAYRTARHHLEMLLAFDAVVLHVKGNRRLWTLPADAGILTEDLRTIERRLMRLVQERPGTHLSELARELGHAKTTLKFRIDRLVDRGLLREQQTGPLRRFYPARPRRR